MDVYSFFRSSRFLSKFKAISVIGCLALSFNTNAQLIIPPHEPDVLLTSAISGSEANINADAIETNNPTGSVAETYVWDATLQQLGGQVF